MSSCSRYIQTRRQGGFEGVRANPPFDLQKIFLYTSKLHILSILQFESDRVVIVKRQVSSVEPGMVAVGAGVSAVEPGMVAVGAGVSAVEPGMVAVGAGVSAVEPGMVAVGAGVSAVEPGMVVVGARVSAVEPGMVAVRAGVFAVEPAVGAGVSAVEPGMSRSVCSRTWDGCSRSRSVYSRTWGCCSRSRSVCSRTWDGFSRSWSGCSRNSTWCDSWKTWVVVVGHRAAGPQAIRNGPATVHGKKYTLSSHRLYTKINTLVTHIIMHYKKYLTRAYSSILDQKSL